MVYLIIIRNTVLVNSKMGYSQYHLHNVVNPLFYPSVQKLHTHQGPCRMNNDPYSYMH